MTMLIMLLENAIDSLAGDASKISNFWDGDALLSLLEDEGAKNRGSILITNYFRHS
jgi:hypothetical protein